MLQHLVVHYPFVYDFDNLLALDSGMNFSGSSRKHSPNCLIVAISLYFGPFEYLRNASDFCSKRTPVDGLYLLCILKTSNP